MSRKVTVYRFIKKMPQGILSPLYMAGTLAAIRDLDATPVMESAREVQEKLLEGGFYYEHTPTRSLPNVEMPQPGGDG